MRRFPSLVALTFGVVASAALVAACSADDRARNAPAAVSPAPVRSAALVDALDALDAPKDAKATIAQLEKLAGRAGIDVGHGRTLAAQAGALRLSNATPGAAARTLSVALPARSAGAQRFEIGGATSGLWLELTPDAGDVAGSVVDGAVVYRRALADTDLVVVAGDRHAEELRVARSAAAPTTARWRVKTGPGARALRVREGRVELVDPSGRVRLAASKMVTIDAKGVRRAVDVALRGDGRDGSERELVATWSTKDVAWPLVIDPIWTPDLGPNQPRNGHAAVLLPDGRLMIYGGSSTSATNPLALTTAEIFDSSLNAWKTVTDPGEQATRPMLAVVDVGGGVTRVLAIHEAQGPHAGARLYDWKLDSWALTGDPTAFHVGGALLPLPGGKMLLVGGSSDVTGANAVSAAEVFDPTTGLWSPADPMATPRTAFGAVVLQDGKILVLGGLTNFNPASPTTPTETPYSLSSAELFDPAAAATKQWTPAPSLAMPRHRFTATVLNDYRVLAVGGLSTAFVPGAGPRPPSFVGSTELLDPSAAPAMQKWTSGPTLALARAAHTATLLNGKLFVIGGGIAEDSSSFSPGYVPTGRAEMFDPGSLTATSFGPWTLAGSGSTPRFGHTATLDATKTKVFLVGGLADGSNVAEEFSQAANGDTCTSADACASGNCVDSVCCDKPCAGKCQTCLGSTPKGTCRDVTGPDPRGTCGDPACVSACNAGMCVYKDATTACGAGNCYGSTLTPAGHCLGTDGICLTGTPHVCAGNVKCADATSCKAKCASDADCAAGACDLTNGTCSFAVDGGVVTSDAAAPVFDATPPTLTTGVTHCTQPSDCTTGFCVDGVCCDTACKEGCHSCALPSSPGRCALEPIGVDLRHECGPALSCLGTCGAEGQCAVAQKGTTCAPSRCVTASTGLGPAACSAAGAKCPTDDSIPFNCAPYTCEQAVGACLTKCETSADCVNGTLCQSGVCAVPPPQATNGGCSYGPTTAGGGDTRFGGGMLALLAISLFAARRRARAAATIGAVGAAAALAGCSSKREMADVDAGASQPAPAIAIAPVKPSLVSELQARPRLGAAIKARTTVTRVGSAFHFTTRLAHTGRLEAQLSADARALTLADSAAPEAWIELVALDRDPLAPQIDDSAVVARGVRDVLFVGGHDAVEEIQVVRAAGPASLAYHLNRGPGVARVRIVEERVEVLDRAGAVRVKSDPAFAVDARGIVRAMHATLEGDELRFALDTAGLTAPIALDPGWTSGGSLTHARMDHTATLLPDGRVFVAGGTDGTVALSSCELRDPKTGTWTDGPLMLSARKDHRAVLLDSGKVLLAGDTSGLSGSTADVFDPAGNAGAGSWTSDFVPFGGRQAMVKLADGRVLVAGDSSMVATQSNLFDETNVTSRWNYLGMPIGHDNAAAALLPDGTVMVAGGKGSAVSSSILDSKLIWTTTPGFLPSRGGVEAFSTPNGVIVLGGSLGDDVPIPQVFEVAKTADYAAMTWHQGALPVTLRYAATYTLVQVSTKSATPRILATGGVTSDGSALSTAEIYDVNATAKSWKTTSNLDVPRVGHAVTQLGDAAGTTLLVGGTSDGKTPLKTEQKFVASSQAASCTTSGDCATGFCIDGPKGVGKICCAVATCPAGNSCKVDGSGCSTNDSFSCVADADCASGHCANGVCCDKACNGLCEACNLSTTPGTCTSLGPSCLGEPADAAPAPDAGTDGAPPIVHEAFTRCTKDVQCGTGHCVEGICCDTACTDRCHSCALQGTIGKCTVEPTGVDLKHECGPGRACLGTCSAGACVGSAAGTQCDQQKCTGPSTGIGPATCEKAGGACQTDKVAVFSCAPYLCEPAFGACRETCTGSDECTQGFSCDTSTQKCVANAPADGGSGGCALGGAGSGAGAGAFALALGMAALGLAARRRR
jgi:hypothetical protein